MTDVECAMKARDKVQELHGKEAKLIDHINLFLDFFHELMDNNK